ncbi:hypothetical protein BH10ACT11_BH10ACT11_08370 [soil metagenome]
MPEIIEDPVHRARYSFEPDGEDLVVDTWMAPGGALPEHYHPLQEESWWVVEGEVSFQLGDSKSVIGPDSGKQLVERNVRHSLKSTGKAEAHLRCRVTPAGDLQTFLTDGTAAAREGLFMKGGIPKNLKGARWAAGFLKRHQAETVMTFPPLFAQKAMIAMLAR